LRHSSHWRGYWQLLVFRLKNHYLQILYEPSSDHTQEVRGSSPLAPTILVVPTSLQPRQIDGRIPFRYDIEGGKMSTRKSTGTCQACKEHLPKPSVTKHLSKCSKRETGPELGLHVVVEGRGASEYWLHFGAAAKATLRDLDHALRQVWLECCGHMSAFTIAGESYSSGGGDRSMNVKLGQVLQSGVRFNYEYDFGSTTELTLRVVGDWGSGGGKSAIWLLARNDPPEVLCAGCGQLATALCSECAYSDEGVLCKKCGDTHECGEDMLLPFVNSPRAGVCGYTG
jgi:hypothetical protein